MLSFYQDNSDNSRPRIESKLGLGTEEEDDTFTEPLMRAVGAQGGDSNSNRTMETMEAFTLPGVPVQEVEVFLSFKNN